MRFVSADRVTWLSIVLALFAATDFALLCAYWFGWSAATYGVLLLVLAIGAAVAAPRPGTLANKVWLLANIELYGLALLWSLTVVAALYGLLFIYGPEPRYWVNAPFLDLFGGPVSSVLVILALKRLRANPLASHYTWLVLVLCAFQTYEVLRLNFF